MNRTDFRIALLATTLTVMLGSIQPIAGADWHVPEELETIQAAVEISADGDHVIVAPGVYHEAIDLLGKKITLRSSAGARATILDGEMLETSIVTAISGESIDTRLEGFTFRNGIGRFTTACGLGLSYLGGAIYVQNGGVSVLDSVFENNGDAVENSRSINGGGAIFACEANLRISGSSFRNNVANRGGAIRFYADDKEAMIINSSFTDNVAGHGGGIQSIQYLQSALTITGCQFDRNRAVHGGAIYVYADDRATVSITGSAFRNGVSGFGGGAYLLARERTRLELSNLDFIFNEAGFGGGLFALTTGHLPAIVGGRITIDKARFLGNTSQVCSGCGSYSDSCFEDGFERNGLYYGGGADLRMHLGGIIRVTNSLFARNAGRLGGGMHVSSCNGGVANLVNNTVTDNESGIHLRLGFEPLAGVDAFGEVHIANSLVRDNEVPVQIPIERLAEDATATVTFSNVEGGIEGDGNLDLPPLFADQSRCDYRLLAGSAGIDAGRNDALTDSENKDLRNAPRIVDDPDIIDTGSGEAPIVDIGAYERQSEVQSSQGRQRTVSRPFNHPCPAAAAGRSAEFLSPDDDAKLGQKQ